MHDANDFDTVCDLAIEDEVVPYDEIPQIRSKVPAGRAHGRVCGKQFKYVVETVEQLVGCVRIIGSNVQPEFN